jgi:hypothetical protein
MLGAMSNEVTETEPAASKASESALRALGGDLLFGGILVAACFALFYHAWPLWEDQGIYHYMAWGMSHGMTPYGDTINMNWPGIVGVHWLARLISGAQPLGLRLLDSLALLLLLANTSWLLQQAGVSRPWRLLAFAVYLTSYYATGFEQTAQRESFCLPLVACGLVACLGALRMQEVSRASAGLLGFVAALGLAVKPALGLPLAVALLLVLLAAPGRLGVRWRFVASFLCGCLLALALVLAFLGSCCDWRGFIEWGVRYAFGPYAQTQWPAWHRVRNTARLLVTYPGPAMLFAAGVAAWLVGQFFKPARKAGTEIEAGSENRPTLDARHLLVILAAVYLSIFLQGKTHCRYHFHPLQWFLAVIGVVLLTRALPAWLVGRRWLPLAAALLLAVYAGVRHTTPEPTPGTLLARQLREDLTAKDQIVLFGFSPTLLADLECRTPFPFVDSWIIYCSAAGKQAYEQRILDALDMALARPEVRYFVVEQRRPIMGFPGFEHSPQEIIRAHLSPERIAALGFARQAIGGSKFIVFERRER